VYATSPVQKVIGEFKINKLWILNDTPKKLWYKTDLFAGIEQKEFNKYFKNCEKGYAIYIGKTTIYKKPKDLTDYGIAKAPQSFVYLK
jgi:predicted transcriptional regulator